MPPLPVLIPLRATLAHPVSIKVCAYDCRMLIDHCTLCNITYPQALDAVQPTPER
jgi:hypothetical protein